MMDRRLVALAADSGADGCPLIQVDPEEGVQGGGHFGGFAHRTADSMTADEDGGSYEPDIPRLVSPEEGATSGGQFGGIGHVPRMDVFVACCRSAGGRRSTRSALSTQSGDRHSS